MLKVFISSFSYIILIELELTILFYLLQNNRFYLLSLFYEQLLIKLSKIRLKMCASAFFSAKYLYLNKLLFTMWFKTITLFAKGSFYGVGIAANLELCVWDTFSIMRPLKAKDALKYYLMCVQLVNRSNLDLFCLFYSRILIKNLLFMLSFVVV